MTARITTAARPSPAAIAADLERLAILVAHGAARPDDARRLRRAAQELRRLAGDGGRAGDEAERLLEAWRGAGF